MIVTGTALGQELCEHLHLDPGLVSAISIDIRYGEMATVSVEMYLTSAAESALSPAFKKYEFREVPA